MGMIAIAKNPERLGNNDRILPTNLNLRENLRDRLEAGVIPVFFAGGGVFVGEQ